MIKRVLFQGYRENTQNLLHFRFFFVFVVFVLLFHMLKIYLFFLDFVVAFLLSHQSVAIVVVVFTFDAVLVAAVVVFCGFHFHSIGGAFTIRAATSF